MDCRTTAGSRSAARTPANAASLSPPCTAAAAVRSKARLSAAAEALACCRVARIGATYCACSAHAFARRRLRNAGHPAMRPASSAGAEAACVAAHCCHRALRSCEARKRTGRRQRPWPRASGTAWRGEGPPGGGPKAPQAPLLHDNAWHAAWQHPARTTYPSVPPLHSPHAKRSIGRRLGGAA
eukprot:351874-Chlamydomonas_euryale.AAC.3